MVKEKALHKPKLASQVPSSSWELELENSSSRHHLVAAWVAIIFDPVFGITDYYNIPESWLHVFFLRLGIAAITLSAVLMRRYIPTSFVVVIPFTLISFQNAYTYSLIGDQHLLGHNLNYMALLIGAALFVMWDWQYSVVLLGVSAIATAYFVRANNALEVNQFFIKGGLLLMASGAFMAILIRTRHNLTVKEIKARIALELSNEEIKAQNEEIRAQNEEIKAQNLEIQAQGEEIKGINENLESLVRSRTAELEKKNKALEEYAFINAHKLRAPVASILGLINLLSKIPSTADGKSILEHLKSSADKLDEIVSEINRTIQRGERK